MIWISSHAGITGNETANLEARQAISDELVDGRPPVAHGFLPNARRVMFQNKSSK
jgi:ribonuclease HI